MKKVLVISVGAMMLLSSCGTYAGQGAATGGWFGSVIGSAIGGISGGHRGSDIGTLIGMAGGAVVGAAVGQAADNARQQKYQDVRERIQQRSSQQRSSQQGVSQQYDSGYDESNSGDDRLYGFGEDFSSSAAPSSTPVNHTPSLEIRNARFIDSSRDGVLTRGEEARVVFEIYNTGSNPVYRVQPVVSEVTGNRHIRISESIMIEGIAPGKGVRYTAAVKADNSLKDGEAVITVGVMQANRDVASQTQQFTIRTAKR